jgi:6-phosphogluconate dehydrogenase
MGKKGGLKDISALVEDTGEANRLVDDALHMKVPLPMISQSVMQLLASRDDKLYWARAIAMMRHGFGGHPFGEDNSIKHEGHVGGLISPENDGAN